MPAKRKLPEPASEDEKPSKRVASGSRAKPKRNYMESDSSEEEEEEEEEYRPPPKGKATGKGKKRDDVSQSALASA